MRADRLTGAILTVALFGAAACAQAEVYRWVDDQGITHYSQTPPPEAESRERVATPPPPKGSEREAWQELNSQVEAMQDREDIRKENALAEEEQQDRERNCTTAQRTIEQLDNDTPMRIDAPEGGRRRMTDTEREAHLEKAREMKEKYCP